MPRPNGIFKKNNDYQKAISNKLYADTPKSVFAALAVSVLVNMCGKSFEEIDSAIIQEWDTLFKQGIVPQKPAKL